MIQLFIVNDPIAYILAKPVVHQPGTYWYYSGGDVNLLGEIIRKATGTRMDDFAAQYLFSPLGITEYEWDFIVEMGERLDSGKFPQFGVVLITGIPIVYPSMCVGPSLA